MLANSMGERFETRQLGNAKVVAMSAESSNARVVSIQLLDVEGREMTRRSGLWGYLATDANGDVMEPHSATLTIAASTDGIVVPNAAANAAGHSMFFAVSEVDGDLDVSITQTSGADSFYLVLILPNGELVVSDVITFA